MQLRFRIASESQTPWQSGSGEKGYISGRFLNTYERALRLSAVRANVPASSSKLELQAELICARAARMWAQGVVNNDSENVQSHHPLEWRWQSGIYCPRICLLTNIGNSNVGSLTMGLGKSRIYMDPPEFI